MALHTAVYAICYDLHTFTPGADLLTNSSKCKVYTSMLQDLIYTLLYTHFILFYPLMQQEMIYPLMSQ